MNMFAFPVLLLCGILRLTPALGDITDDVQELIKLHYKEVNGASELFRSQYDTQCGLDYDNVDHNETLVLPWMAALYTGGKYFCDGSLIHRRFVVTSAWCVYNEYRVRLKGGEVKVKLGLTDYKKQTHLQVHNVRSVHIHPEYNPKMAGDYNMALLELEEPLEYNRYIRPVCLPPKVKPEDNPFYRPHSTARVIGLYRYVDYYFVHSFKNLDFLIQTRDHCNEKVKNRGYKEYYLSSDRWFCAESNDVPSCNDITFGSPLMQSHTNREGSRIWTQVGLSGEGWCRDEINFIAVHVQNLMPWVEATLEAASDTHR